MGRSCDNHARLFPRMNGIVSRHTAQTHMTEQPRLLEPITVGDLRLPNRVFMAPLTRCRASAGRVPNALMRDYYVQRASAGLILSEATSVSPMGVGYPDTPGIWSPEQVKGWKMITEAVHAAGGRMLLQLWHVGRISDPSYLDGALPVAPSAIAPRGHVSLLRPKRSFVTPRALETKEIPGIVEAYRKGAQNAQAAGFDGVEIHGANGYLLDQFLQDSSNHRTDQYGGPIENRARLMLEVTDAVIAVWGADRVGMHLAPRGDSPRHGRFKPSRDLRLRRQGTGQTWPCLHLRARVCRTESHRAGAQEDLRPHLCRERGAHPRDSGAIVEGW